jgi:hypothetical protein
MPTTTGTLAICLLLMFSQEAGLIVPGWVAGAPAEPDGLPAAA